MAAMIQCAATRPDGFYATYNQMYGNPFGFAHDGPIRPSNLQQPALTFPWENEVAWYFTGGPHGGWAAGSAWAALDFAPDKDQLGCYVSQTWVTASAPGIVVYSDFGGVLVDLDRDGDPGTGWVLVYWHVDSFERIPLGRLVETGDRLGHTSCEGGFSSGTHLHFARRYNGEWIAADGNLPFNLDGWVSEGTGNEYDGYLVKGGEAKEACVCAEEEINEIIK
ncbi:MAG: M23 family metallopeptidase, partial [Chloroflexota bacterium]